MLGRPSLLFAGIFLAAIRLSAAITPAALFQDGAVLQQGKPVPIWGTADPGEKIVVEFASQTRETTADADGSWSVTLDPLVACAEGRELRLVGKNEIRRKDILVGEVWLCSGQSNMVLLVRNAKNAATEIASSDYPLVRQFEVARVSAESPSRQTTGKWVACAPQSVGEFSAVAYFFARELYRKLKVPVGIINSSWGGTKIESWMSASALRSTPASAYYLTRWDKKLKKYSGQLQSSQAGPSQDDAVSGSGIAQPSSTPEALDPKFAPSGLFNGMIHPLIPAALAGIVWYQGEANSGRYQDYEALFLTMIKQWRRDWSSAELPFFFVQLPNYEPPEDQTRQQWAFFREAQAKALQLPGTGMVVTLDVGEAGNIHPIDKQDVGYRLAARILESHYGAPIGNPIPVFAGAQVEGDSLRLTFRNAKTLRLQSEISGGFELAGSDRIFYPAVARIEGECLIVQSGQVSAPVAVRYAWSNNPPIALFNGDGLPVPPFRSDTW